jgi:hypothetical protein
LDIQILATFLLAVTAGAALFFYFRSRRALQQLIVKRESDQRTADNPKP